MSDSDARLQPSLACGQLRLRAVALAKAGYLFKMNHGK
jgi:hypothetical protein